MDEKLTQAAIVELINRTQSTVLALACSLNLIDQAKDLDDLRRLSGELHGAPRNPKHLSIALSSCFEAWIIGGHYTRQQLLTVAHDILVRMTPDLPKGPTREAEHDHD